MLLYQPTMPNPASASAISFCPFGKSHPFFHCPPQKLHLDFLDSSSQNASSLLFLKHFYCPLEHLGHPACITVLYTRSSPLLPEGRTLYHVSLCPHHIVGFMWSDDQCVLLESASAQ